MQVCVAAAVARAEEGGAGVAVLGLGRADGQAADLAVRAVHHLHELTTPRGERRRSKQECESRSLLHQGNKTTDGPLKQRAKRV